MYLAGVTLAVLVGMGSEEGVGWGFARAALAFVVVAAVIDEAVRRARQ